MSQDCFIIALVYNKLFKANKGTHLRNELMIINKNDMIANIKKCKNNSDLKKKSTQRQRKKKKEELWILKKIHRLNTLEIMVISWKPMIMKKTIRRMSMNVINLIKRLGRSN